MRNNIDRKKMEFDQVLLQHAKASGIFEPELLTTENSENIYEVMMMASLRSDIIDYMSNELFGGELPPFVSPLFDQASNSAVENFKSYYDESITPICTVSTRAFTGLISYFISRKTDQPHTFCKLRMGLIDNSLILAPDDIPSHLEEMILPPHEDVLAIAHEEKIKLIKQAKKGDIHPRRFKAEVHDFKYMRLIPGQENVQIYSMLFNKSLYTCDEHPEIATICENLVETMCGSGGGSTPTKNADLNAVKKERTRVKRHFDNARKVNGEYPTYRGLFLD